MDKMEIKPLINEAELFVQLAQGDEGAFVQIYWYYIKRLYPFVLKMVHDEGTSEEIIQDVFVLLWEKRALLSTVRFPTSYLFSLASNRTLNYLKKESNHARILERYAKAHTEFSDDTQHALDFRESEVVIREAVASLPDQRRMIFELSRDRGFSNDQIAEQLGISKQTVKNQLVTALKNIRLYMEQQGLFSFAVFYLLTRK